MDRRSRRAFLGDVGRGMLIAGLGSNLVTELGLGPVLAQDGPGSLSFGKWEQLVRLMQETQPHELQPLLVERLKGGADLRTLVAAGALANARTFGGEDYVGYHAAMALMPAYQIAQELPARERALPVLKVLYRNAAQIQHRGGRRHEKLQPVAPAATASAMDLRKAVRGRDLAAAERTFARMARGSLPEAFANLQLLVRDDTNVHRVVLAWRAWDLLQLTGEEHAHTMLRQSVRFCVDEERARIRRKRPEPGIRRALPRILDEHKLLERARGTRKAEDAWIDEMSGTIFSSTSEQAAAAVGVALAEGFAPETVGEAISLAANRLLLHDPGRRDGTVHGASVGVHASDAANAWRSIVRVSEHKNVVASLVTAAYHTGGQGRHVRPRPFAYAAVEAREADALLQKTEAAIRSRDQAGACAAVHRYGELGHPPAALFDLLRGYAVSEDGKLHAEKFFRTVTEEFASTRAAFRWRHLVALARVTASEYGTPAAGYADAVRLLKA